jgi:hypothetical protein
MGISYAQVINSFQPLETNIPDTQINTDRIDTFFTELTDIFVCILENGFDSVENNTIPFENKYTKAFFMTGLTGLKQALIPMTLEIILEFLSVQISRERDVSALEMFEICLLKRIIPVLRPESVCIKTFIDFLVEFCSGKIQSFQIKRFTRFINIYKLHDCYVLNAQV